MFYVGLVGHEEIEEQLQDATPEENLFALEDEDYLNLMETTPEISMNALAEQFHPSTLRLTGKCAGQSVKILIDNGSNNNFITSKVAEQFKLKQTPIQGFKVGTGSGVSLSCNSKCQKVTLNIQDHVVVTDLFVLDIKGADVVLGVQ